MEFEDIGLYWERLVYFSYLYFVSFKVFVNCEKIYTMNALILIYIPILAGIVWATNETRKRGCLMDAIILLVIGVMLIVNGVIRHFEFCGYQPDNVVVMIQQVLSSLIVPFAYMFFSMQVNRPICNPTTKTLFALILILICPNILISCTGHGAEVGFKEVCIVGEEVHRYTIADVIISLQALVSMLRIIPLFIKISEYGLEPSNDVKLFFAWWVVTITFVIFASLESEGETTELINVVCHIIFMIIVVGIFVLVGRGIDFVPSVTKPMTKDGVSGKMAQELSNLIKEKNIHLN